MKILFLSYWFPYPANNGSRLRIYNLLRGLSQHHTVTLLSFIDQPNGNPEAAEIQSICSDVHVVPLREFDPHSVRAKFGFLSSKPRSIIDTFSPEMAGKITQLLGSHQYDLVIASQLPMAAYYPYFKHRPAIFEEVEIGLSYEDSRQAQDWKKRLRHTFTWFKLRMYLSRLLNSFQAVTVVSKKERGLVEKLFPRLKEISIIPNCINMESYANITVNAIPDTMIFTGSFRYKTNYEAMQWFIGKVFPFVLEEIPSARLIITGDHANLPLPPSKNVTFAGYVDDVRPLIASSTVALTPLWSGGGTRLKVLEAMAIGTPVVSTSKGAEGLDAISGEHLFEADDPQKFSEYVIRLLQDATLRSRISANARQFVMNKYDWSGTMPVFLDLIKQISKT